MSANHHEGDSDNEIDANHVGEDQPKVSRYAMLLFKAAKLLSKSRFHTFFVAGNLYDMGHDIDRFTEKDGLYRVVMIVVL